MLTPVLADENSLHDEKSIDKDKAFVSHGEVQPAGYPTDEERHTLRRIVRLLAAAARFALFTFFSGFLAARKGSLDR